MNMRTSIFLTAIIAAMASGPTIARAQGYRPPAGPTITPYLDYYNVPISPLLDNYYTYARPRAELRSYLNRQDMAISQQSQRLNQLGNQMSQMTPAAAPTGTGSTFFNHSHYYPGMSRQAQVPRRR